jgi:ABC-type Fe3+ transport system substrate-binding protein
VAVAAVARIIVARRTLGTRPQRLTDLADPRWAGKMQIQDPNEAGFRRDLGALLTARGPGATRRFLVDLSAVVNIRPPVPTEEEIARALMDGSAQVAMLDHPSARAAVPPGLGPDEAPVELSAPSTEAGGVAFRPLVASIPSGFSGRDSALAALDALLTLQAQRALVSLTGFYPVHPLAEPPAGLPPIAPDQWAATPLADERSRNDSLDRLLVQVGLRPGVDDAGQEGGGIAAPVPGGPPTASESSPQPVR